MMMMMTTTPTTMTIKKIYFRLKLHQNKQIKLAQLFGKTSSINQDIITNEKNAATLNNSQIIPK